MQFTVAIDGPAAAGKGTIGRAVAARFGFRHLDTGLLYRAVAVRGGDPVAAAEGLVPGDLERGDLRSLEAGQAASRVAVIPEVRAALVTFQRRFARGEGGAVLDGRDIGTVICPDAEVKLYVTASPEVRAHRRWLELGGDEGRVLAEVMERDARDTGRADAPLRSAADAVVLDTSVMGIDEAVARAVAVVERAVSIPQTRIDGTGWRTASDVWAGLADVLRMPDWHGRNLNALLDGLRGGVNGREAPFRLCVVLAAHPEPEVLALLENMTDVFRDARTEGIAAHLRVSMG